MATSAMSHLGKVTQQVSEGETSEEKIAALSQAFELFTKETERLEEAYRDLQRQFLSVNVELEQTNRKLNVKVQELDTLTTYLDSIVSNMLQGLLFVNLAGDITTYNMAAENMLGIPRKVALLSNFWDNFSDDTFGFSLRDTLSTGNAPATSYVTAQATSSSPRELEVSTTFSLHSDESMRGLIVLLRDITEIRRLQVVASRNDRMKELGEMAASVAHEIRNPLGGIKGFASLLVRDLADNTELQQMAEYIVDGTTTLDRLVTEVLNYSRPITIQLEPSNLAEQIEDICTFAKADSAFQEKITLAFESTEGALTVPIDRQLFRSSILNLFVNAAQAMPNGGTITTTLSKEKGRAVIVVQDTGTGIAAENLENIFSPFFTTKTKGNGFGLSEVHKIIQAHGGTIDVESEMGIGTTFTIKLPMRA